MPTILGGTAVKAKPPSGSAARLVICSQIRMPAPSRMVWTGRERVRVSSILWLSMPTSRAPRSASSLRRGRGQEGVVLVIGLGAPVPVPAGVDQHRLAARRRARRRRAASTARPLGGADDEAGQPRQLRRARARRGRRRRRSGGRARRDRCRYWRPCRSGRSGRSSRRRRRRPSARASNSRRCAAPGRPL